MRKKWLSPGQSPAPTARRELHPRKVLLSVWWDIRGVIHHEILEPGRTITAEVYWEQLDLLKSAIDQKRPALANRKGTVFHCDKTHLHTARITLNKLSECG
uniref:Histone-lysine N-methyltransferase SETMAR-like n=1 Tax=Dermatophagoides pteronyssinus TaxID=6956 RepID=A0A6P6Y074_DERPT|nr:histone-lysine N-methyltransferase SETMAR-like [Dermatophagoides pteronyssinus]